MLAKTFVCLNCGIEGEIELQGVGNRVPPSRVFRHLGHNPFSGHMHYQCPACNIVLLIDPADTLADYADYPQYRKVGAGQSSSAPQRSSMFECFFHNQHAGN